MPGRLEWLLLCRGVLLRPALKGIAEFRYVRRRRAAVLVAAFVTAATLVSGCASSSTVTTSPDPVDQVKCQVSLATPAMLDARGGTGAIAVTTQPECAWNASATVSWISALSPASGQGTGNLEFRVAVNENTSGREGAIVVNGVQVRVAQRAAEPPPPPPPPPPPTPPPPTPPPPAPPPSCTYSISPSSASAPTAGSTGTVSVSTQSGCPWTGASGASWITVTAGATGSGNGSVSYLVLANAGAARTGTLTIAGRTFTVTQAALNCTYSISPNNDKVGRNAGTGSISVTTTAGCTWTAVSNVGWITVTSGASGTGNGTVAYRYDRNMGKDRKGTLTVAGRTFTLDQDKNDE